MSDKRAHKKHKRDRTPVPGIELQLQAILDRLNNISESSRFHNNSESGANTPCMPPVGSNTVVSKLDVAPASLDIPASSAVPCRSSLNLSLPCSSRALAGTDITVSEVTDKLVSAINAMPVRSNDVFISNFDPAIHNFDSWCSEVDHIRELSKWSDRECLARVGNCITGDAKLWIN